jgi:hypothetical protein
MSLLTPDQYDTAERIAAETTTNRIIECSRAVAFLEVGYPIRISSLREAARYTDVMHEGRTEDTFQMLGGLTSEEKDLIYAVASKTAALTERVFGCRVVPRSALLRSISMVRHIRYLYPEPTTVFEIGPGSGYVGALLLELGYGYACTDIAQAFYIFQSHLLSECARDGFTELATSDDDFLTGFNIGPGQAVHVPWWKFFLPNPQIEFRSEVVTCNHTLCEMHPSARAYTTRAVRSIIGKTGAFIFEGWGSPVHTPIWRVGKDIAAAGLVFAQNDVLASVVVATDSPFAEHAQGFPMPNATPADEATIFHPAIHVNPANQLCDQIARGRSVTARYATRSLGDLDLALRDLGEIVTDDERFLRFIGVVNV